MNFYNLNLKEESLVKRNGANFFFMEKYADIHLNINKLRLQEFKHHNASHQINNDWMNKNLMIKSFLILGTSCLLIYKFKSIMIVPIFLINYSLINKYLYFSKEACYFCENTLRSYERKKKYNLYYNCINKVFERNENIKTLDDFEKELDQILKELTIK
jgi:hypothetical protein